MKKLFAVLAVVMTMLLMAVPAMAATEDDNPSPTPTIVTEPDTTNPGSISRNSSHVSPKTGDSSSSVYFAFVGGALVVAAAGAVGAKAISSRKK